MRKEVVFILLLASLAFVLGVGDCGEKVAVSEDVNVIDFESCIAAGNPAMESYPRQCRSGDNTYIEEIKEIVEGVETVNSEVKEFEIIAKQWEFVPGIITVKQGDNVKLKITSIDVDHGIWLNEFGVNEMLEAGKTVDVEFVADKKGEFSFSCNVFCGSGHGAMRGTLIVK